MRAHGLTCVAAQLPGTREGKQEKQQDSHTHIKASTMITCGEWYWVQRLWPTFARPASGRCLHDRWWRLRWCGYLASGSHLIRHAAAEQYPCRCLYNILYIWILTQILINYHMVHIGLTSLFIHPLTACICSEWHVPLDSDQQYLRILHHYTLAVSNNFFAEMWEQRAKLAEFWCHVPRWNFLFGPCWGTRREKERERKK